MRARRPFRRERTLVGPYDEIVRLRLYHHPDGARVAYREVGAGPPLALLHSALLSHKEWEPAVERSRRALPRRAARPAAARRLRGPSAPPLHARLVRRGAGWVRAEVLGPRPLLAGHDAGAEILLHAVSSGRTRPSRLVLMPSRLHAPPTRPRTRAAWQMTAQLAAVPGLDRLLASCACAVFTPERGVRLSARGNPAAADLVRHAFADVSGNSSLARSWAKCARSWPRGAQSQLLEGYPRLEMPVLLLWADQDRLHPLAAAEEALALLPHGQLRVLESTGFLMAYDDPVGLARELAAFCG